MQPTYKVEFDRRRRATPEGREKRNSASLDSYYRHRDEVLASKAEQNRDIKIRTVMVLGGKCQRCGWCEHPAGLDFHHRDPDEKVIGISKLVQTARSWEEVLAEIVKCDLLCANCHRIERCRWQLDGLWPEVLHDFEALTDEVQGDFDSGPG